MKAKSNLVKTVARYQKQLLTISPPSHCVGNLSRVNFDKQRPRQLRNDGIPGR